MSTLLKANKKSAVPDSEGLGRDPFQPASGCSEKDKGGSEESSLQSFRLTHKTSTLPLSFLPPTALGSSGMSDLDTG